MDKNILDDILMFGFFIREKAVHQEIVAEKNQAAGRYALLIFPLQMLGMYFDALSSLSAARTIYLNYVDYSPKVGGYYYSTIYSGPNATEKNLGTVKSAVFVR